jgi:hypothetical protein
MTTNRWLLAGIATCIALPAHAVDLEQQMDFNIRAQKLDMALVEFSRQAKIQVITSGAEVRNLETNGAMGRLTIFSALEKLLKDSGLSFSPIGDSAVSIKPAAAGLKQTAAPETGATTNNSLEAERLRLAQATVGQTAPESSDDQPVRAEESPAAHLSSSLEQVIVTGTHIRGLPKEYIASPVFTYTGEDIERSGFNSLSEYIPTLPQNFSGDASEASTTGVGAGAGIGGAFAANANDGFSAFSLRGLGSDATITLFNGRRMANAGMIEAPTVSFIPAALIERIEVVPDGASATYGADAVGGVVNLITRRSFDGLELRVRGSTATEVDRNDYQASLAAGHSWDSGNMFGMAAWQDREALVGEPRRVGSQSYQGYPGLTSRYRSPEQVKAAFALKHPEQMRLLQEQLAIIDRETAGRADAKLAYASITASLNNRLKKAQGLLAAYANSDVLNRSEVQSRGFKQWLAESADRTREYGHSLAEVDAASSELERLERQSQQAELATPRLLEAARILYRYAQEKSKADDLDRTPGFKQRDWPRIKAWLEAIDKRYDERVDKALVSHFLRAQLELPISERERSLLGALGIRERISGAEIETALNRVYENSQLATQSVRLGWMDRDPQELQATEDAFIRVARSLYAEDLRREARKRDLEGRLQKANSVYMKALIAYRVGRGESMYPDANGTLRVSFGQVSGRADGGADGLAWAPFTTVRGSAREEYRRRGVRRAGEPVGCNSVGAVGQVSR